MNTITIRIDGHVPAGLFLDLLEPLYDVDGATIDTSAGGITVHLDEQRPAAPIAALAPAPTPPAAKPIDRTPPAAKGAAERRPPRALAPVPAAPAEELAVPCDKCERRFASRNGFLIHRAKAHPAQRGVLAAGPIEGDHPKVGETHDDWETRKRAAAAGAL